MSDGVSALARVEANPYDLLITDLEMPGNSDLGLVRAIAASRGGLPVLVITGVRQDPCPKVAYHQMEVRYGEFRTEIYLHWAVETNNIEAVYSDGFLQVTLPKLHPRKVQVQVTNPNAES